MALLPGFTRNLDYFAGGRGDFKSLLTRLHEGMQAGTMSRQAAAQELATAGWGYVGSPTNQAILVFLQTGEIPETRNGGAPQAPAAAPQQGQPDIQAIYDRIVGGWDAGRFKSTDEVVQRLQELLKVGRKQALEHYANIQGRLRGTPGGTGVTPPPAVLPGPPKVSPPGVGGKPKVGSEFGPYQKFLEIMGLPAAGGGYKAAYQRGLYDPLEQLFRLESLFAPATGRPQKETFLDYLLQNKPTDISDITARAGDIMRSLLAAGPLRREKEGMEFGIPFVDPVTQMEERQIPLEIQQAFLRNALRPAFGYPGAQRFVGRLPEIERQYMEERRLGTGKDQGFLEYLVNRYNLAAMFNRVGAAGGGGRGGGPLPI